MTNIIIRTKEQLKNSGVIVEGDKIFPSLDSDEPKINIDFYNNFVDKIDMRKRWMKRKEYWEIFEKEYKRFYPRSKVNRETIKRYIRALTYIWQHTPQLGFNICHQDKLTKKRVKYYEDGQNLFGGNGGEVVILKTANIHILNEKLKNIKTLDKFFPKENKERVICT